MTSMNSDGASAIVNYDNPDIPIYIREESLSDYPSKQLPSFLKSDIEWILGISGQMKFEVGGSTQILAAGDVIMINAFQLFKGYSIDEGDCKFLRLIFKPEILFGNDALVEKYVTDFTARGKSYYIFKSNTSNGVEFTKLIKAVYDFKNSNQFFKEYEMLNSLRDLWKRMLILHNAMSKSASSSTEDDYEDLLIMLEFIQTNYSKKISLDDIGHSADISRSTCCKIFKKYLNITPNDYLNSYRMEVAVYQLKNSKQSISEIASTCGFNHLSYFSKSFYDVYGEKPTKYRKEA